jgi:glutamate N-acetyltransferase/amino-acid N-acetyltransferase
MRFEIVREKNGGLTAVLGFQAAGVACGLKATGDRDLALIYAKDACTAAGVFTQNRFPAAPVLYDKKVLARNTAGIRAVVINSGCANACTGEPGLADARRTAALAGEALGIAPESVLVMSTGVIGQPLALDKVARGIVAAANTLSATGGHEAVLAIMTTDTRPKESAVQLALASRTVTIGGMCKGAGMIHPDMATMLGLIVTDAAVEAELLAHALRQAVKRSFNMITVDGDTSTNDTVLLLANGLAANPPLTDESSPGYADFVAALTYVATELAKMIVRDGEGATKFITVQVRGAPTFVEARQAAMAVARSSLVKTAIYGQDANWGRVLAAVGYSGVEIDPGRVALWFGTGQAGDAPLQLVKGGRPFDVDEARASDILAHEAIEIAVDLGLGAEKATVWTCDLSHEYVDINAHYRT